MKRFLALFALSFWMLALPVLDVAAAGSPGGQRNRGFT